MTDQLDILAEKITRVLTVLLIILLIIPLAAVAVYINIIQDNPSRAARDREIIERLDKLYNATVAYQTRCEELDYPYSLVMRISEAYDKSRDLDDFIRRLTNLHNEATATELKSELSKRVVYELGQLIEKLNVGAYIEAGTHLNNMWRLISQRAVALGCPLP